MTTKPPLPGGYNLPDECGLNIALKFAREWVRKQTDAKRDKPAAGQSGFGVWVD